MSSRDSHEKASAPQFSPKPLTTCIFALPFSRLFLRLGVALLACLVLGNCGLIGTAAQVGLIKMKFGCLAEGSLIDTPTGPRAVEDLAAGDVVTGYDGSPVLVRQLHQYQEDPTVARHLVVRFAGGEEIRLSPRHRIGGIPAGELEPGRELDGHVVTQVRPLSGVSRSFDLLTDDAGYRIHGIPVNSMIEEMFE